MTQQTQRADSTLATLDKGLRILELLATDEVAAGLTLTEMGRRLDMHRTTLFRFLTTLRARGYIDRDLATDRYRLGLGVLNLASGLLNHLDVRQIARPVLLALRDQTEELVHLAVLDRDEVMTIERVEGNHAVSLQTEIGARRPAYCTASGKAMLPFLPEPQVERILARGMPALTPTTVTSLSALLGQLQDVRRLGFAVDNEERTEGVRCVAAPVLDLDRHVVGAISVAVPSARLPLERVPEFGARARAAAETISRRLGYAGPWFPDAADVQPAACRASNLTWRDRQAWSVSDDR